MTTSTQQPVTWRKLFPWILAVGVPVILIVAGRYKIESFVWLGLVAVVFVANTVGQERMERASKATTHATWEVTKFAFVLFFLAVIGFFAWALLR